MRVLRPAFLLLIVAASGCRPAPGEAAAAAALQTQADGLDSLVELTPSAKDQIAAIIADAGGPMRLRITIKPGGCTGMSVKLDLDPARPAAGEKEFRAGGVRCVANASDHFLVQGAMIDWVQTDTEQGFKVTFPNKTPENQRKTAEWIEAAAARPAALAATDG